MAGGRGRHSAAVDLGCSPLGGCHFPRRHWARVGCIAPPCPLPALRRDPPPPGRHSACVRAAGPLACCGLDGHHRPPPQGRRRVSPHRPDAAAPSRVDAGTAATCTPGLRKVRRWLPGSRPPGPSSRPGGAPHTPRFSLTWSRRSNGCLTTSCPRSPPSRVPVVAPPPLPRHVQAGEGVANRHGRVPGGVGHPRYHGRLRARHD